MELIVQDMLRISELLR